VKEVLGTMRSGRGVMRKSFNGLMGGERGEEKVSVMCMGQFNPESPSYTLNFSCRNLRTRSFSVYLYVCVCTYILFTHQHFFLYDTMLKDSFTKTKYFIYHVMLNDIGTTMS
jgi:hypothetical protein